MDRMLATAVEIDVPAKVQRRRFSAEYRLRILKQADACKKPGELGALLRQIIKSGWCDPQNGRANSSLGNVSVLRSVTVRR